MKTVDPDDPKGLIFESFRMEGIDAAQCRSVFLDWALSLPLETDTAQAIRKMIALYGDQSVDHPMLAVLKEGLQTMAAPRRRGGWRSRNRS